MLVLSARLFPAISQLGELRQASKAVASAQNDAIDDLIKWSNQENNRAIKDTIQRIGELSALWLEAQKQFVADLKEVKNHFEV